MNRSQRRAAVRAEVKAPPRPHVRRGIPSGLQWYAKFGMDFYRLTQDVLRNATPGVWLVDLSVENVQGSTLWTQRSLLMENAMKAGCSHLLFIDTDQTFPAVTLRKLLSHKKEVVACNIAVKQIPSFPTARYAPVN